MMSEFSMFLSEEELAEYLYDIDIVALLEDKGLNELIYIYEDCEGRPYIADVKYTEKELYCPGCERYGYLVISGTRKEIEDFLIDKY